MAEEKKIMSLIQKYNLNEEEIASFKISQVWIDLCQKYFPNYNHTHKNGWNLKSNPKKSIVFKMCFKLLRETKGLIEESDYPLYIRAQLEILKIQNQNNPLILVEPGCLVGDKAWKRWKLWKKRYDSKIKIPLKTQINQSSYLKAKEAIVRTKKFIHLKFGDKPTIQEYKSKKSDLINWLNFGNISPYYLSISPYMKQIFNDEEIKSLNFDTKLYAECINNDVEDTFKKLFFYEFT